MTECVQLETEVGLIKGQLQCDAVKTKCYSFTLFFSDQVEARIKSWQRLTIVAGDSRGIRDVFVDVEEEDGFIVKAFGAEAPVWWQQQMLMTASRGVVSSVSYHVLLSNLSEDTMKVSLPIQR